MADSRTPCRPPAGVAAVLAALSAALLASPAAAPAQPSAPAAVPAGSAQTAEARARVPLRLEVAGVGGAIVPLGDLTRNRSGFNTSLASTGTFGGEAAVWHRAGFGIAFEALSSEMDVNQAAGEEGFVVPGGLGRAEYLGAAFELRYRYTGGEERAAVQPEWGLGIGFRRLEFDPIAEPELEDSTDLIGSLRFAVFVPIGGRFGARVAVRATRGSYGAGVSDEELSQTDLVVGAGAVVRVF